MWSYQYINQWILILTGLHVPADINGLKVKKKKRFGNIPKSRLILR